MNKILKILLILAFPGLCLAEESCFFTDSSGMFRTTSSMSEVPSEYRASARCEKVIKKTPRKKFGNYQNPRYKSSSKNPQSQGIRVQTDGNKDYSIEALQKAIGNHKGGPVRASDVDIGNNQRRVTMNTSLGKVEVRWDRSAEKYFNSNIDRVIGDAFRAGARVVSKSSFPYELKNKDYGWQIVVMDDVPKSVAIKSTSGGCHPGWIRPPADIFIAAQTLAGNCNGQVRKMSQTEATNALAETMVHELGHAIEYHFLGKGFGRMQRWHAEGFATWFESLAAANMSSYGKNNRSRVRKRAKQAFRENWNPRSFNGSSEDYARAYSIIATIAETRTILRLADTYKRMSSESVDFLTAIEREIGWDKKKLMEMVKKHLGA